MNAKAEPIKSHVSQCKMIMVNVRRELFPLISDIAK